MIDKTMFFGTRGCTLILAFLCLIFLTTTQCSRREDRSQRDGSTVTIFWPGYDERLLGPYDDEEPQFLLFSRLWHVNRNGDREPDLAEHWEHSEDLRTWTYYLRRDARWHDGMPVTAHDLKFSLELFVHPDVMNYQDICIDMESVTVLDEFTFAITYTRPKGPPDDWACFYPKHLLEDLDPKKFNSWDFWTHPIGNGPYRYVRHVPKIMMELEANPDYYKGKPKIGRVVFKLGGGDPLIELLSGNVDMVNHFNADDIPKLPADGRFRVSQGFYPGYLYPIFWNHRHALFRDPQVRRALTLAINRHELVQVMNFPENTPIFDTIFSFDQFYRREIPEPLPYDPERAKQLLEEVGWRDNDGDGIRERDGEEARFTAIAADRVAPTYVQAQLLRIGIKMEIRPLTNAALRVRLLAGEFEAVFGNFVNNSENILNAKLFNPGSPIGYSNPEIVKLLRTASSTFGDPEAVNQIYRELMPIFCEELPMTFLYPMVQTSVVHRRIRGPKDWNGDVDAMENLWLEEEKKIAEFAGDTMAAESSSADQLGGLKLPTPDYSNVPYGQYDGNVLDLWLAKDNAPTPLVIYYHGGGFRSGDKSSLNPELLRMLIENGISVAAANYRLSGVAPYPAQMHDAARALQFLRLHAKKYSINPERVGAIGGSAGAGISQWLAYHDDLADSSNQDPLLRQSTRLTAVVPFAAQTSYDPRFIMKLMNTDEIHPALIQFFGMNSAADVDDPKFYPLFEDSSPINHLTVDDPPILFFYPQRNDPLPPNSPGEQHIHHPKFGFLLKEKADELGVECTILLRDQFPEGPPLERYVEFFKEKLLR